MDDDELEVGMQEAERDGARRDFEAELAAWIEEDGGDPPAGEPAGAADEAGARPDLPERSDAYWRQKGQELAPFVLLTWGGGLKAIARGLEVELPEDAVTMDAAENIATAAAPVVEKYLPDLMDRYGVELAFAGVLAKETSAAAAAIYRGARERAEEKARQDRQPDDEKAPAEDAGSRFDGLKE